MNYYTGCPALEHQDVCSNPGECHTNGACKSLANTEKRSLHGQKFYGPAFYDVMVYSDGTMYIHNGEYISQVNYNPLTGEKAETQIKEDKT